MKPEESVPSLNPTARWWLLAPVVLGQLMISFGERIGIGEWRLVAGCLLAFSASLLLVFMERQRLAAYLSGLKDGVKTPFVWWLAIILLVASSALNFAEIRIGYAEDEMLEFSMLSLPSWKLGWKFWSAYDETFTANVLAMLCRVLPMRYETLKFTAFLFRTAAGLFALLLAGELFGRRVGSWAGLVIGSSVMYMCSFNTVIKEICVPALFLAALFFTFHGLRTGRCYSLLLGGTVAGLVCYSYVSKAAFAVLLVCWPVLVILLREREYGFSRARWKILFWVLGLVLISVPFWYYIARYPSASIALRHAGGQSSLAKGGLALLIKDSWYDFMAIVYKGDPWATNNYNMKPFLWWPLACAFWVGLAVMISRLRETRMAVPLLLMAGVIAIAGANYMYTPNYKLSRAGILLAALPCAIGLDYVSGAMASRSKKISAALLPCALAGTTFFYGLNDLYKVNETATSRWFCARYPVGALEEYVFDNPQYRFWGVNTTITDLTEDSVVRRVPDLRTVIEAQSDGRDEVFLFNAGRREYMPETQRLLALWTTIFPGGEVKQHTVPVEEGAWPVFISYRVPRQMFWSLPPVDELQSVEVQAAVFWKRAQLLSGKGLPAEAWREAVRAGRLDVNYYELADSQLGNSDGLRGRLKVLVETGLWEEAREELEFWSAKGQIGEDEKKWKAFLDAHGLEMTVYSTYTVSDSVIGRFRLYLPELCMGNAPAPLFPHFAARAEGRLLVQQAGDYYFGLPGNIDTPMLISIDGKHVLEFSRERTDDASKPRAVRLERGMHEFIVENCTLLRYEGEAPVPAVVPDPISRIYGFKPCWSLTWGLNPESLVPVPSELLFAPGAEPVALPPKL